MPIPVYLAMTASEVQNTDLKPKHMAWMACHFSCDASTITNLPKTLPQSAMLILDDSTPPKNQDPQQIADALESAYNQLNCIGILLDFQCTDLPENAAIVAALERRRLPFAASEAYAVKRNCAVFLPPVPLAIPIEEYISRWKDREIWLELALDGAVITVTKEGCREQYLPAAQTPLNGHLDPKLHCHYAVQADDDTATFTLWRTKEDITGILTEAEKCGVKLAVGLWQELR